MIQYADETGRGGPPGPVRRVRAQGSLVGRMLAVLAAVMLAAGGAGALPADAAADAPGIVMVICSDGVAKTIVLDARGDPVETSGEEACPGHGPCCTLPDSDAPRPEVQAGAVWEPAASAAVFQAGAASARPVSLRRPAARGPPSEEDA